ncbi:MAG: hypothetical protein LBU38_05040, partial [Propionibacteriaceae bacterium]|nr:hypothetical protein [Propionibacteriaceae bacterium]
MSNVSDFAAAALALENPQTSAVDLQAIAAAFPTLRPRVGAHPNAYPELIQWIETAGDRPATTPNPQFHDPGWVQQPTFVEPTQAGPSFSAPSYNAPVNAAIATIPATTPIAVQTPKHSGSNRSLKITGIITLVLALITGGTYAWFTWGPQGSLPSPGPTQSTVIESPSASPSPSRTASGGTPSWKNGTETSYFTPAGSFMTATDNAWLFQELIGDVTSSIKALDPIDGHELWNTVGAWVCAKETLDALAVCLIDGESLALMDLKSPEPASQVSLKELGINPRHLGEISVHENAIFILAPECDSPTGEQCILGDQELSTVKLAKVTGFELTGEWVIESAPCEDATESGWSNESYFEGIYSIYGWGFQFTVDAKSGKELIKNTKGKCTVVAHVAPGVLQTALPYSKTTYTY